MKRTILRHPILSAAFVLAALATLFFAVSIVRQGAYWVSHPGQEQVRPWMTLRYIARSWGLPVEDIDGATHLPPADESAMPLRRIARDLGVSVDELIAEVEAALAGLRTPQSGEQDEQGPGQ